MESAVKIAHNNSEAFISTSGVISAIGCIIAALGVYYTIKNFKHAINSYNIAQRWKRHEFLAQEWEKLYNDFAGQALMTKYA